MVESRAVNYNSQDPVHMPGQIFVYRNTQARQFSVSNAKLISRTPAEAENTYNKLQLLRGWCMPRFGINSSSTSIEAQTNQQSYSKQIPTNSLLFTDMSLLSKQNTGQLLGSPPPVLYLSAYSNPLVGQNPGSTGTTSSAVVVSGSSANGNLYKIPVVITSLDIPYPTDCDYIISSQTKVAIPIMLSINVSLVEAHSPSEYNAFSLDSYISGILPGF